MAVTVNVNGLTLCHKGSGGVSKATLPDVCKTPAPGGPVPLAYPNVAFSKDLAKGTSTIKADGGQMCANYGSEFSLSIGDEPGTVGGLSSGTFKKEATWITYSLDVKLEGKGACRLTDKMFHNHGNTVNASGEMQSALARFMAIICPIICDVIKRKELGEKPPGGGTWTQHINRELSKHGDALARLGVKMERTALFSAARGMAAKWGRKAITRTTAGLGKKAAVAWVPFAGPVVAGAFTVLDVVATVADGAALVSGAMDLMRVRPDFSIEAGGKTLFGDIKLPGDKPSPGQFEAYEALNKGEKPPVLNKETCKCS